MKSLKELKKADVIMKGYIHPIRLKIIKSLKKDKTVTKIMEDLKLLTQSETSQHLAYLRRCKLVEVRPEGSYKVYSINKHQVDKLLIFVEEVSGIKPTPSKIQAAFTAARKKLAALNHKLRYEMIEGLLKGEAYPSDVMGVFKLEQSETSRQLNILKRQGLVISKKEGKQRKYSVNTDNLESLLNAVDSFLQEQEV